MAVSGDFGDVSGTIFRGRVSHENAVSVRGRDGLFQYGWLIRKEEDGFLVDLRCGPDRIQIVSFGMVFRLEGIFSAWDLDHFEWNIKTVLKENDLVEVLLQSQLDKPWTWHSGLLIAADFDKGRFGQVSLSLASTATIIVPGQQIRRRPSDSELEHSLISSIDAVTMLVHYPLPLDFCINHLPSPLLAEILDSLSTDQQAMMCRVCSLWTDIRAAAPGSIVSLHWRNTRPPLWAWHNLWKATTRIVVLKTGDHTDVYHVRHLACIFQQIKEQYGYPRLVGVALRDVSIRMTNSRDFWQALGSLRDVLASFAPTCRLIKLIDPELECYDSDTGQYLLQFKVITRNQWIDVSETGFSERFLASLSVHHNIDIHGDVPEISMKEQRADSFIRSGQDGDRVSDRLAAVNTKHSEIPFPSRVHTGNDVAIRGEDGLLHYARVIAKEDDGLLVDFCNAKPFAFVPFGKVYSYPRNDVRQKNDELNEPVEVLLRLQPQEPWKWYLGNICVITGRAVRDRLLGFVKVSVGADATVTAVVDFHRIRAPYDPAELEKHLLKNGDRIRADMHRRLDWEMKISDLSLVALEGVLGALTTTACSKVRSVCKLWDQVAATATLTAKTIYLEHMAHRSVACLNNAWGEDITTVICKSMGRDFWSVCHLLRRLILQNGCGPLKILVLVEFNQFPVFYTVGAGISDELSLLASVCQCLVFCKASFQLGIKLDSHIEERSSTVWIRSFRISFSTTDWSAQLFHMIANNVEKSDCQLQEIRSYFSQPERSSECVDCVLEILNDVDNIMGSGAADRSKECSVKYLLTLQPKKLKRLAVAAIALAIEKYCPEH